MVHWRVQFRQTALSCEVWQTLRDRGRHWHLRLRLLNRGVLLMPLVVLLLSMRIVLIVVRVFVEEDAGPRRRVVVLVEGVRDHLMI